MKEKIGLVVFVLFINSCIVDAQIESGVYDNGLKVAYNPSVSLLTAYYEGYSGYDESADSPRFSCVFYIHGYMKDSISEVETYFPLDKSEDLINGKIKLLKKNVVSIKLNSQHGGCWNVWNFSEDYTTFKLEKSNNWIEIRYINIEKAYFYSEKQEETKRKAFVLKGDIVYIDKIEDEWIHCSFYGKTVTKGWVKLESVNQN